MMFTTYSMKYAKDHFKRGYIKSVRIEFMPIDSTYRVIITSISDWTGYLVDAREGYAREFKTVSSAISAINSIGFKCLAFDCVF